MIAVPAGVKVLIAVKPVDFRKGGDGLAALVREALGEVHSRARIWFSGWRERQRAYIGSGHNHKFRK
jgi:hypothetical protein